AYEAISTSIQLDFASARRARRSPRSATAELVRATAGVQLARIAALASRAMFRRGIIIGTAMMPAIRQPKNATMNSMPGGNTRMARSPGRAAAVNRCARADAE